MVDTEVKVCFDMSADNSDQQISSNKRCTGPLHEVEGQERPAGYYQRFGVTRTTEEDPGGNSGLLAQTICLARLSKQGEPDFENLVAEIRGRVGHVENPGIWYVSGRGFYMKNDSGSRSGGEDIQIH